MTVAFLSKTELLQDDEKNKMRQELKCYDSSYAPSLMTMLMTMLMTILRTIVDRSSLEHCYERAQSSTETRVL